MLNINWTFVGLINAFMYFKLIVQVVYPLRANTSFNVIQNKYFIKDLKIT